MDTRAWATLTVRCFGLYHLLTSGASVLWWCMVALAVKVAAIPAGLSRYNEQPLAEALLYPLIWCVLSAIILAKSDPLIRWIARIPTDSPPPPSPAPPSSAP